jgi:predicted transcriptional regulator
MLSLWRREKATVNEVCDDLERAGHNLSYTTVLTLLQRLRAKGFVETARISPSTTAYSYSPTVDFDSAVRRAVERFLHDYQFDSSGLEILRSMVEESLAKATPPARRRAR